MAAVVVVLQACGANRVEDSRGSRDRTLTVRRLAENGPSPGDWARFFDQETARSWRFEGALAEPWRPAENVTALAAVDHVELRSEEPVLQLFADLELPTGPLHRMEVDFDSDRVRRVRIFWASTGQRFSQDRGIAVDVGKNRPLVIDLNSHQAWRGEVAHLRLDFMTLGPPVDLSLREIRLVRATLQREAGVEIADRPIEAEIDEEIRTAFVAVPDAPVEWRVEVPERAVLRTAYGTAGGLPPSGLRFRILATRENGDEPVDLFSADLSQASQEPRASWQPADVDLGAFGGERVKLSFHVTSQEEDSSPPIAYWANPEIVARRPSEPTPAESRYNVVLISIDTLRADHLSLYGYQRPTTPNIDRWAAESGVTFLRTVSSAPWTLPSHVSMLTGVDALSHGVNYALAASDDLVTLAEILRDAGFSTAAYTGGGFLHPRHNLDQGFDLYRYWRSRPADRELESNVDSAKRWIQAAGEPFFLFFHTYEVHVPFRPRQPFLRDLTGRSVSPRLEINTRKSAWSAGHPQLPHVNELVESSGDGGMELLPPAQHDLAIDLYDAGIGYMDHVLGTLLDALGELGVDDRTVVVLTSDHGEGLGEHGLAGHAYLYDFNLLVPLVISSPGAIAGQRVSDQVGTVDITPTILDLVGLPVPEGLSGRSLAPTVVDGRPPEPRDLWTYAASSNHGVALTSGESLVKTMFNDTISAIPEQRVKAFDLRTDPLEADGLSARHPTAELLLSRISERLRSEPLGVQLRVHNPTDGPWFVRLKAPGWTHPFRTKWSGPPACECVELEGDSAMLVEVPSGLSATVLMQGIEHTTLRAWLGSTSAVDSFRFEVSTRDLGDPFSAFRSNSGWSLERGELGERVGLELVWGKVVVDDAGPDDDQGELDEQLRALGYVQ